jgi:polysaccharide export outer membrane protein
MSRHALLILFFVSLMLPSAAIGQEPGVPRMASDANYRFGPEDVLQIQVWGHPDLSGTVIVSFSGVVQIPSVGDVRAEGRTPGELADDLLQRYQLLEPSVSDVLVSVIDYKSKSVTVLGEVRIAGRHGFREMPGVWEAILEAGGATPAAELGGVQIVRAETQPGEERVITLDLSRGIDGSDPASLPELRPNDQIVVPTADKVPGGGSNVQILGAVNVPGTYRITTAHNVIEALSAAGGPTSNANLNKVYLTRVTSDGAVVHELKIRDYLKEGRPLDNLPLQAGDTLTLFEQSSFWSKMGSLLSFTMPFVSLAITLVLYNN